jgi:hypothetical protein
MNPNNIPVTHMAPPAPSAAPAASAAPAQSQSERQMFDLQVKINKIYDSVEKTRKYFLWTMIITVALFVLPLIGLIFAIPSFLSQYSQISSGSLGI